MFMYVAATVATLLDMNQHKDKEPERTPEWKTWSMSSCRWTWARTDGRIFGRLPSS